MTCARRRPLAIDLFAGAGGLTLGFEQAGFDVAAAVEFDPIHAATHELNFPNTVVLCRDVVDLTGEELVDAPGLDGETVDAIVGGPPCQGFSLIGQRVLDDPRNSLVFHFMRLVLEVQPRTFMMENVPGMIRGGHTQLLEELIQRFEDGGYRVRLPYQTLNAANFGVPQDRERLFLIGTRVGEQLPDYPTPRTKLPAARRNGARRLFDDLPQTPTVRDAIEDLPEIESYPSLFDTDELEFAVSPRSEYAARLSGGERDPRDLSHPRDSREGIVTGCRRSRHTERSRGRFSAAEGGKVEPISRFFKLDWDGVCNTLRAGTASDRGAFSAPRPIHPENPRCISVREAARLHSYPDWFRFHKTIWHGFRQIGNSVPPLLARALAAEYVEALRVEPYAPSEALRLGSDNLVAFNMRSAADHFDVPRDVIPPRRRAAEAGE